MGKTEQTRMTHYVILSSVLFAAFGKKEVKNEGKSHK